MHHFSPRAEGLIPMHQFFLTISRCDQNYQGENIDDDRDDKKDGDQDDDQDDKDNGEYRPGAR